MAANLRLWAEHLAGRIPLVTRCTVPLTRLSVCKKVGLGYVPAATFMAAVAVISVITLRGSASGGVAAEVLPVLLVVGAIAAGTASIISMLTAFSVGERVRSVLTAAEAAADGDLDQYVPVREEGDEVDRLGASFNHMTMELRQRLETEQVARAQAENASLAKTQFVSTMSHEIRTPLTAIMGFSELLEEQASERLSEVEVNYLRRIREASDHLLALANDALDVARVEAGHISIELANVPLDELLTPVTQSVRPLAETRGLSLTIDTPQRDVVVSGDPIRLRQVLYNLLSNATKFTPTGGSVCLRVFVEGRDLVIEVEDNGIGIPDDARDRVFGMFERVHGNRIEAPGAGLGLALARRLVELHHGDITFRSKLGVGTTFRVRLPNAVHSDRPRIAPRDTRTAAPGAESRGDRPGSGLRVLLVEDNHTNARLFADVLEMEGHVVTLAHDGETGGQRALAEPFDLMLIDIRMPGRRGDELCRLLRDAGVATTMIALSANALPDEIEAALDAGFDSYLAKPISASALRAAARAEAERQAVPAAQDA